jgi:methyl-accepting chemotaxis protein
MNKIKTTWLSKLVSGAQLDAQAQELAAKSAQLDEQAAEIAALQKEMANTAQELKVRCDIMDLTSIVSFADLKGDIVTVNEKFIEVSKYDRSELIGQPHNTTRHPDMPKETFKQVWATIRRGDTFRGVIKNRAKDGTPYYVDAVIAPFIGDNGKPSKYLGVRYDITEQELERQNAMGILGAIDESYGYIEFDLNGTIIKANKNFLNLMEYQLDEIEGKHHRIFIDPAQSALPAYAQFWSDLNAGKAQNDIFKRITKSRKEVWIQAVYAPVKDEMGRVFKIVKIATDITAQRTQAADYEGQIEAISKSQAVIEFNMDGVIQTANEAFLNTMGYTLSEIRGKHHSMFVDNAYRSSHEYKVFWEQLNAGEYSTDEYKRIAKGGAEVWLQASYNPIMDLNGNPFKVVKYASNITGRKTAINEVKRVLMSLSEGDLTTSIEEEFEGEFKELGDAINSFVAELSDTISQIHEAVETISSASTEISQGNTDLSSRTEQQASSLEETASSMEELTGTVRLNSENATQANGLASQASTVAMEGGALIQKVVTTMSSINDSARKIADIIGVIDGIAFQTNILALNAAVEAARAGEQGRGFAVVASEVRTLAQRSANAAKDIKELISDSVTKIESGNTLVNQSGETMDKVVTSIKRVNDIMSEIAAASVEQATGIDEVGKAIAQMDEVTQQNAALVEEAAAAAESLQSQAEQLAMRVSIFKIAGKSTAKALSAPPPIKSRNTARIAPPKAAAKPPTRKQSVSPAEDEWESF